MNTSTLDDILYELALTSRCPNADVINDFVRRYPEHSHEIIEFAADLAILSMEEVDNKTEPCTAEVTAAVEKALREFQRHLAYYSSTK